MYTHAVTGITTAGVTLSLTGGNHDAWLTVGAFTLVAAGTALTRLLPRRLKD
ncbi:hypothetical protein [Leekyejoonella antrihumi]|uniref:hypothetical protein n=1 Tax=Leekyejoonella antrihumi TaxID=1660198 RepID=UPI001647E23E|nr:hypothetical protein [Leekyejoonella antrihumi]